MRKTFTISLMAMVVMFAATMNADVLNDFTFHITSGLDVNGAPVPASLQYQAQVYAWSGSLTGGSPTQGAVGPALWSSGVLTYTGTGAFQAITVNPNVSLGAGNYVALFTIVGGSGSTHWGDLLFTHVAGNGGGGFNFYNNVIGNPVNTGNWDDFADFGDLAWTAHFSSGMVFDTTYAWNGTDTVQPWGAPQTATYGETFVVPTPEPGTVALFGSGLIGLAGALRRRLSL